MRFHALRFHWCEEQAAVRGTIFRESPQTDNILAALHYRYEIFRFWLVHQYRVSIESMEVAASVVGLLSFSGQILNGLVKLSEFIQDHREADSRAENALRETQLLTSTVTKLRDILQNLRDSSSTGTVRQLATHIVTLQTHLESCGRDLDEWVENRMSAGGSSSKLRKVDDFLSNRRARVVRDLESRLSSHRAQISLSIGSLNM